MAVRRGLLLVALVSLIGACFAGQAHALSKRLVVTGLTDPLGIAAPRSAAAGKLWIVERPGTIKVWSNGALSTFMDIRSAVLAPPEGDDEQGLLGLAFSPHYATNHKFYIDYINNSGDTRVAEYRSSADGTHALLGSRRLLLGVAQPFSNHNGGQLAFGPGGLLNIGLGDGGSGCDPNGNAQRLRSRLGKILSLNVVKAGSAPHVRFYGLRNPWRFSFDRRTGDVWIGDVGQDRQEEIDRVPHTSTVLRNFGWDVHEGFLTGTCPHGPLNHAGALTRPIAVYNHTIGCSITGGYVYRGSALPRQRGRYFYGDFCNGTVWSLRFARGAVRDRRKEAFTVPSLSSFGESSSGELYMCDLNSGRVYRLV